MTSPTNGPWVWHAYPAETPDDAFGPFTPIVALWRSKAPAPGVFPRWKDFDILDFQGWWGQLSLAEMHRDPLDPKWVLWGSMLTNWWGMDYTGRRISEQPHLDTVWGQFEQEYFQRILDERLIGFITGTLEPLGREYLFVRGVDLPLENDGVITHVMSAYELSTATDTFVPEAEAAFIR